MIMWTSSGARCELTVMYRRATRGAVTTALALSSRHRPISFNSPSWSDWRYTRSRSLASTPWNSVPRSTFQKVHCAV